MKFKQGDTFDYSGPAEVLDAAGAPVDLTGWTVASHVRFPDKGSKFILTATWVGANVRLRSTETLSWPIGIAEIDVEFTSPAGDVVSTETVRFEVTADLTSA
jgi:putative intracellular protease/amidase